MSGPHKSPIRADEVSELLLPFGVDLSAAQIRQVSDYADLLMKWNSRLNLTSIDDPREIVVRHFGESMLGGDIPEIGVGRLADVGSGAGFPGIPLKILFCDMELVLIESNKRKCAFLAEVVRSLGLAGVTITNARFGDAALVGGSLHTICSRALGQFHELLRWAERVLDGTGKVALWVGEGDRAEVSEIPGWMWSRPLSVPGSERRSILVGSVARSS